MTGPSVAWDDRQALARQCADLRDENDDLRKRLREAQATAARDSLRLIVLQIEAEDAGSVTPERMEQLANDAWDAIDRRYWS